MIEYESQYDDVYTWDRREITFRPHFSESLEVLYVTEGGSRASLDFKEYVIKKGDIFLAFPNQIHSFSDTEPSRAFVVVVPRRYFGSFAEILSSSLPSPSVLPACEHNEVICEHMRSIQSAKKSDTPYKEPLLQSYINLMCIELLSSVELIKNNTRDKSTERRILTYCTENYMKDFSRDKMAKDLFINKSYISHLFGEKFKMSLPQYITMLRTDDAHRRIKNGESATDAAFAAGFQSMRSFYRSLKK